MSEPMWHVYGPNGAGEFHVHGPSDADAAFAATLGPIIGLDYLTSFDHEPTPEELTAAVAP